MILYPKHLQKPKSHIGKLPHNTKNVAPQIQTFKANKSNLKGVVFANGERISLYKFKHKDGKVVKAAVLKKTPL